MNVIKVSPRGYCYGVVDALVIARKAAMDPSLPRPIYILGMIVHNHHVTEALKEDGIITLDVRGKKRIELLDEVDHGTVIFTAHGVSPDVRKTAEAKRLTVIDATCPDVTKTHTLINEKIKEGYHVIYIGKKGHPEPEGAIGVAPDRVHLVETVADIDQLHFNTDKILITNQTTMSQWDVMDLMNEIKAKYPQAENCNEICRATQTRQEAVATQAKDADLLIVVGDPRSNNSNRLAQVSKEIAKTRSYRIADLSELKLEWLNGVQKVAVTAGASTPTQLTKEVTLFLDQYDPENPETWSTESQAAKSKNILPKVKVKARKS
ncbi:4-hydroxy-3-methylbut-2-enyl diphosphate reductase [Sporolactobacillus inulinus]|uniref:4-hydroxy-3-methylbut-2-enyl diphosphate reductase n=1 Tax=Sporolactobacillus inulinus CASD TaxID=1069536 RepID=A0A0U1QN03_9BACL|nr:4-hydroxy-3-methylbut-2-enyl diphosphate reductase [Sporolactobacillus inulinus]KLI02184.1 4-hydroxy-3-methylbut-2-enyl diphosphate reductase [Sporolactobacillus inulinus CASD]GEB76266.1 4-hydroxy-3-methylbut-2-enyl diphosphate reductase [Sporolactobacillus inulinus]